MTVSEISSKLRSLLTEQEFSLAEIQDLKPHEASEILWAHGLDLDFETIDQALGAVKSAVVKKQNQISQNKQIDRLVWQFEQSRTAANLRNSLRNWKRLENGCIEGSDEIILNCLDNLDKSIEWFQKKLKFKKILHKCLIVICKEFSFFDFNNILKNKIEQLDFQFVEYCINRLKNIQFFEKNYSKELSDIECSIESIKWLRDRIVDGPLQYVSQVEFGGSVMSEIDFSHFNDLHEFEKAGYFRHWMAVFAKHGLINQKKVDGKFQFRSTYQEAKCDDVQTFPNSF